ncbi:MAG: VOC family protein [Oscillospiraceae bacterium]|nr:VOC family protein [Oscillospiraceae bacterium]
MKIEHIGLYVFDLEGMRNFYAKYFGLIPNDSIYENARGLRTCFMRAPDSGARLELMTIPGLKERAGEAGFIHLALSVGSKEKVDEYAARFKAEGIPITSGPRTTGDGYYECCVLDPEGNQIEITI